MRNKFPGYYKPSKEEFDKIWENGIFVFDSNVLLDFYRSSDNLQNTLFKILEILEPQIWLPYQVGYEYHKNINIVISEQIKKYEPTIKKLKQFKEDIEAVRSHPFLSEQHLSEINSFFAKYDKELTDKLTAVSALYIENPIKERLANLMDNKIGDRLSEKELQDIEKEGLVRYNEERPPGFKDKIKEFNKYGDLIIWKEILKKAKTEKKPFIFITGDVKEDWIYSVDEKKIGPHPELISEFRFSTGESFYIYTTGLFLKIANEKFKLDLPSETIEEAKTIVLEKKASIDNETENTLESTGETSSYSDENESSNS